jgi:hypothetical protein
VYKLFFPPLPTWTEASPIYMTVFLSNISDVIFDVSFDKSYSVVKNVSEIYMSKQDMLPITPYVSVSLQHCVSVCTYIAW